MPVAVISAILTGATAALIGRAAHSTVAGFVALVVISAVVISVAVTRRRRQETTA
jgi:hypothetical protein